MIAVWVILAIVVLLVIGFIAAYNGLVRRRFRVEEALSDIDVQLKRRYELVPNLVETVKGYATHERELFEKVTAERAGLVNGTAGQRVEASNQLTDTLRSLFAVAENYPELKANQNFLALQAELTDTQDKIMASQRFYNANVRDFNTAIQTFPRNLIANGFGFKPYDFIEAQGAETQNVQVRF